MKRSVREVQESPVTQGEQEHIHYEFDFSAWGTPSSPELRLTNLTTGLDDGVSGELSVNGDVITTPAISGLTAGNRYRLECLATVSGNRMGMYVIIEGE